MSRLKLAFIASQDKEALRAKRELETKYAHVHEKDADVVVVLGGDGKMLEALRHYIDKPVKVFGMNKGTVGFLMNEFSSKHLPERIEAATLVKQYPELAIVPISEPKYPTPLAWLAPQEDQVWINYLNHWIEIKKAQGFFDLMMEKYKLKSL